MGAKCSNKVDIYSFGVILWELVTGESPQRGRMRSVKCVYIRILLVRTHYGLAGAAL
jgi:serine/threonine protein kinase